MTVEECIKCVHHVDLVADSALCRFNTEIEYKVAFQGEIVNCPLQSNKKRSFSKFFKK